MIIEGHRLVLDAAPSQSYEQVSVVEMSHVFISKKCDFLKSR